MLTLILALALGQAVDQPYPAIDLSSEFHTLVVVHENGNFVLDYPTARQYVLDRYFGGTDPLNEPIVAMLVTRTQRHYAQWRLAKALEELGQNDPDRVEILKKWGVVFAFPETQQEE